MSGFQWKVTFHTKNKEDLKMNKITSIGTNTKMAEIAELFDKDCKVTMIKMPQ